MSDRSTHNKPDRRHRMAAGLCAASFTNGYEPEAAARELHKSSVNALAVASYAVWLVQLLTAMRRIEEQPMDA